MFLADNEIMNALENKEIVIENFDLNRLQAASYDVALSNRFLVTDKNSISAIDPVNKILPNQKEIILNQNESFVLHPHCCVLGEVKDFLGSDKYLIQLSGKSSLARIGLIIHNTAGIVNPGHFLKIVLELCNLSEIPIILRPGMPIGQVLFSKLTSTPERLYSKVGRYNEQNFVGYR
jgi:dCTP deaminase